MNECKPSHDRKYEYVIPSFALDPEAYRERDYYNLRAGRKQIEDARLAATNGGLEPEAAEGGVKVELQSGGVHSETMNGEVKLEAASESAPGAGPSAVKSESGECKPGKMQTKEHVGLERSGEEQPGSSEGGPAKREFEGGAGEPCAKRVKLDPGLEAASEVTVGEEASVDRVKSEVASNEGLEEKPFSKRVGLEPGSNQGLDEKPGVSGEGPGNSGAASGQSDQKPSDEEEAGLAAVERFLISKTEGTEGEGEGGERKPFKYTPAVQKRLNALLAKYTGTHNFHNFTTRVKANDGQVGCPQSAWNDERDHCGS